MPMRVHDVPVSQNTRKRARALLEIPKLLEAPALTVKCY